MSGQLYQPEVDQHAEQHAGAVPREAGARPSPAAPNPVDEAVRIRDRHQLEIKLNYPLNRGTSVSRYDLECFIFVPRSLEMHSSNYSKARFYDDLQTLIRFKTPPVPLSRIVDAPEGPMAQLRTCAGQLQDVQDGQGDAAIAAFEYRLKLHCCILQSALRDFVAFVDDGVDSDDREQLVQQYLTAIEAITVAFRALRRQVYLPSVPRRARAIYAFGDEYQSLLVERSCFELLGHLGAPGGGNPSGGGLEGGTLAPLKTRIMDVIAQEIRYRTRRRYPSIPSDQNDNEQLIFRRNVFKKYMQSVLYLETRTRHEGRVIEHGLFGIAAGLSMLFATGVLFLSQSFYGPLTLPVFLTLVVGYMFKDRIKEILRVRFSRMMSSVLFDHKTRIYSKPGHSLGHCREAFDFVSEAKVPERVMKLRARDHITEIESEGVTENVLRYRKRIKLTTLGTKAAYHDIDTNGINDIIRFNVLEFTRHMGDPRKELFVLTEDGYKRVKAERVYHLNMVLRYGPRDRVRYKRLRIVLNRRRIKRIETVFVEDQ